MALVDRTASCAAGSLIGPVDPVGAAAPLLGSAPHAPWRAQHRATAGNTWAVRGIEHLPGSQTVGRSWQPHAYTVESRIIHLAAWCVTFVTCARRRQKPRRRGRPLRFSVPRLAFRPGHQPAARLRDYRSRFTRVRGPLMFAGRPGRGGGRSRGRGAASLTGRGARDPPCSGRPPLRSRFPTHPRASASTSAAGHAGIKRSQRRPDSLE